MIITLKDGSKREFPCYVTAFDVAVCLSEGLARTAVAAVIDGVVADLNTSLKKDCALEILTFKDARGAEVYRHTAAHVLAQAVKSVYPTCKLAIGPAIENGFYYDFDFKTPITQEDLSKIEAEMARIIKANFPMEKIVLSKKEAILEMEKFGETYKLEILSELPDKAEVSFYKQGAFVDLCRGPHLLYTGVIKAFKLTGLAGAYWRGNEKNKMLTRIYGTAFDKKADLDEYLAAVEEAKKRDHNKIGRDLGIFMTEGDIGQGLPLLMPKGAKIIQIMQRFVEDEEEKRGYLLTKTPLMAKNNLYKTSGHWDHYQDKMFIMGKEGVDDEVYALRPMTCPFQYYIYKNGLKSYRDLPVRYGETATLFRKEASGEMHGLIRVRQFTLSDGHIVCTPAQLEEEFKNAIDLVYYLLDALGMRNDVTFRFSKWDKNDKEKYINDEKAWEETQSKMRQILNDLKIDYYEADGEAAFYGPKLDVQTKNVFGKEDTIITLQIDFAAADRFDLSYVDEDGEKKRPYVIHRSSIGCYERTLALLIEKYAGALPVWLAPVQVKVISLTDRTIKDAQKIAEKLRSFNIRCETDLRSEKVGYKIREAQLDKIPYMVIIGDKEVESKVVAVRGRKVGDLGIMPLKQFTDRIKKEIEDKSNEN